MALFEVNISEIAKPEYGVSCIAIDGREDFVICKSPEKLKSLLAAIEPGKTVFYISDGDWSMHDLVMELLKKYQPADLFISTYALREYPVRQLILAIDRGEINSLNMLLDYRAPVRTPEVFEMAKMNCSRIGLINIHAKITVIESPQGCVTITGSANWTKNPKVESGTISCSPDIAHFYRETLKSLLDNAPVFD